MADLYYLNQYISKTLATSGGIDASQTTDIELDSVTGIDTTKPGICCISWADPLDTGTAEWITYTSIDVSNKLVGATRGAEGFSAKTHSVGATVTFPISRSHVNNINDMLNGTTSLTLLSPVITGTASVTADGLNVSGVNRQAIINGNFDIWQRGTSNSESGSTNAYGFLADRWFDQVYSGSGGSPGNCAFTASRQSFTVGQTDVPNEPKYFHRLNVTAVGTQGTSNSIIRTLYDVEDVRTFAGKTVTLSFYAKADSARTSCVGIAQGFGSGGSTKVKIDGEQISLTTSWKKFTVSFDMPSISGKTIGTDHLLQIDIAWYKLDNNQVAVPSGEIGTWATGTFDLAQVQLCAGSVALPFQPKSFGEELRACQRYYEKSYHYSVVPGSASTNSSGIYISGLNNANHIMQFRPRFRVIKRTIPTITSYSEAGTSGKINMESGEVTPTLNLISDAGFNVQGTNGSVSNIRYLRCHWTADAEL